ncbi:MAG: hypothetical protein GF398_00090 [Chitinivibrionales bacterium]|nr:hypothetical protein [Chitinivibrionales bacterium]
MAIQSVNQLQIHKMKETGEALHEESEEKVETSDPRLLMQKELLRLMYSKGEDEEDEALEHKPLQPPEDSVIISQEAQEYYRRESARAAVETQDGTLTVTRRTEIALRTKMTVSEEEVQSQDPLIFDLDGDGIELTDVRTGEGVSFDITGDGRAEQVSWVKPDDGFITYDKNGNGIIDSGKELFGDQNGAVNGFAELARHDGDANGIINRNDAIFSNLRMWQDLNQNGFSEDKELHSLASLGIEEISLNHDSGRETIAGNIIAGYGEYSSKSESGLVGEVYLNYIA